MYNYDMRVLKPLSHETRLQPLKDVLHQPFKALSHYNVVVQRPDFVREKNIF